LHISSDAVLEISELMNPQFTDITIDAGVTLEVPSGTVLRATGQFVNNGQIRVREGAWGGTSKGYPNTGEYDGRAAPHPGLSVRPAGYGESAAQGTRLSGGLGGREVPYLTALSLIEPGHFGGGGGASNSDTTIDWTSGRGGGTFTVLAMDGISIGVNGSIEANGSPGWGRTNGSGGGGGGGGGVIVLASKTSIELQGVLEAKGGGGGHGSTGSAAGGGGGGGIIQLIAPTIDNSGTLDVGGGAAGSPSVATASASMRRGGGGGGACGGDGGDGGGLTDSDQFEAAENGDTGRTFERAIDPTALF
jgi:hypothetical protein